MYNNLYIINHIEKTKFFIRFEIKKYMRKVQVKTVILHYDCNCELKKKVVTTSMTTTKKAGSCSLVVVSLGLQSFFGCIWNHSFNLDLPHIKCH